MSRNTFRLGTREAAHYLALFDAARASIVPPNRLRPFGRTSQAVVTLGEGDMEFDILTDVA
jgi:hypothetical protein